MCEVCDDLELLVAIAKDYTLSSSRKTTMKTNTVLDKEDLKQ